MFPPNAGTAHRPNRRRCHYRLAELIFAKNLECPTLPEHASVPILGFERRFAAATAELVNPVVPPPVPTPVFQDGLVVITNAHGSARPIYAIHADAVGDITEKKDSFAWQIDRAGNYMQTPLLDGGLGYFCFDNGILTVYQMSTGEKLYQRRLVPAVSG